MLNFSQIKAEIDRLSAELLAHQQADGSFKFCFENPITTDAYLLVILCAWNIDNDSLKKNLVSRILSKQEMSGQWKAYPDEEDGNLSLTITAYIALSYTGHFSEDDFRLKRAADYIAAHGGFAKADLLTRAYLSVIGVIPWPILPFDPGIIIDPPSFSPVQFYDLSSYARIHFVPIIALLRKRFSLSNLTFSLPHALTIERENQSFWPEIEKEDVSRFFGALGDPSEPLDEKLLQYMLLRIEGDGTLLSYASSTFFMLFAFLACGYEKHAPVLRRAISGMISLLCHNGTHFVVQNSPSNVWDTSLSLYSLLQAGKPVHDPSIQRGIHYLLQKQQVKTGDWQVHAKNAAPGGWGFSESNTIHPDLDDTQAALHSLSLMAPFSQPVLHSWEKGVKWLLSMQNNDGGFAAFEKNTNKEWLGLLPITNASDALIDNSCPDITGRVLYALGKYTNLPLNNSYVQKAVKWLKTNQEKEGSWYGRWGICYLYGTWGAVTGLAAAGIADDEECLVKAVQWLEAVQRSDGSWSESCKSDALKRFKPLHHGTLVQTAWALDALITVHPSPTPSILNGIHYLLQSAHHPQEKMYPVGAALPGSFYLIYHSYPSIWPLKAISHFYHKYSSVELRP